MWRQRKKEDGVMASRLPADLTGRAGENLHVLGLLGCHAGEPFDDFPTRQMPAPKMKPCSAPASGQDTSEAEREAPHRVAGINVLQRSQSNMSTLLAILHGLDS